MSWPTRALLPLAAVSGCGPRWEPASAAWDRATIPVVSAQTSAFPDPDGGLSAAATTSGGAVVEVSPLVAWDRPGSEGLNAAGVALLAHRARAAGVQVLDIGPTTFWMRCPDAECARRSVESWVTPVSAAEATACVAASRQVLVNRAMADPLAVVWWRLALDGHPAAYRAGGRLRTELRASDLESWRARAVSRSTLAVTAPVGQVGPWTSALAALPVRLPPDRSVMPPAPPSERVFASFAGEGPSWIVGTAGPATPWSAEVRSCWERELASLSPGGTRVELGVEPSLAAWVRVDGLPPEALEPTIHAWIAAPSVADRCATPGLDPLHPTQSVWVVRSPSPIEDPAPAGVSPDKVVTTRWRPLPTDALEWIQ